VYFNTADARLQLEKIILESTSPYSTPTMPFDRSKLMAPSWGSDPSHITRFVIVFTDLLTMLLLCITLGLFYRWAPWREMEYSDWSDALMLGVLLISLIWTLIITLRPAWTYLPLHPGHYVAWELISWLFIFGSVLSALLGSELLDMLDIDEQINDCSGLENHYSDSWRCKPRIMSLQKLQIAANSFALVIA